MVKAIVILMAVLFCVLMAITMIWAILGIGKLIAEIVLDIKETLEHDD